ncbi:hypothetical protein L202_03248 [Cryptococcus amylolentus CBS 6039]|uniref:Calpain catalytic domain-containing protein n=2 Tax=Cryptococcus amylolentus TaxID=104669 RepID=A0A1E3HY24_9TREE|nr:hypothetical protein L202_03248 [Cryptococcus amylolentus CBS 6039]ODN81157.1 hypothetical protein L202_03248 [Cryptococcus amylolentus CBS 6039]ODO09605.1 hypothetical protein I350_03213 [Cryptococcus amylolentus CBS 6273]
MVSAAPLLPTDFDSATTTSVGPVLWDPVTGPTCDDITQNTLSEEEGETEGWYSNGTGLLARISDVRPSQKQRWLHQRPLHRPNQGRRFPNKLCRRGRDSKVWDPDTLKEEDQDVTLSDAGNGDGNDDSSISVWWPSALQAAVRKHGGSGITDGKFNDDGGFAHKALSYLSGYEAVAEMDDSKWWDMLKSHIDTSPMTVCTNSKTSKLKKRHCYAAMTVVDDKVRLHNPWGDTQNYEMSKIKDDIEYVAHFKNWDAYLG